nr:uncharacterized protein LOC120961907 isoform X1 [Aegilops tauschii subsp. strangulata]
MVGMALSVLPRDPPASPPRAARRGTLATAAGAPLLLSSLPRRRQGAQPGEARLAPAAAGRFRPLARGPDAGRGGRAGVRRWQRALQHGGEPERCGDGILLVARRASWWRSVLGGRWRRMVRVLRSSARSSRVATRAVGGAVGCGGGRPWQRCGLGWCPGRWCVLGAAARSSTILVWRACGRRAARWRAATWWGRGHDRGPRRHASCCWRRWLPARSARIWPMAAGGRLGAGLWGPGVDVGCHGVVVAHGVVRAVPRRRLVFSGVGLLVGGSRGDMLVAAAVGLFPRLPARRRPVSTFDSSPRRPGATFVEGLSFSRLRSIARLATGAAGPILSRAWCSRTELVSCTVPLD